MPRTIQCTNCGVALNVPDHAAGRRLKCPKCGTKLHANDPGTAASSTTIGLHDARPDSSQLSGSQRSHGDETLPTAAGDLRETFDLPLLTEEDTSSAKPTRGGSSDALSLFQGDKPAGPRRQNAAEARSKARRCPTCGGVVPVGMSLCSTCGLDLESGRRVDLLDDLAPPPPPPSHGPPIPVVLIGGLCLLGSIFLALFSGVKSLRGANGWGFFFPLCVFGGFAAVQFLRGKSAKLLLLALTLGAVVDVVGLIVMPVYYANMETKVQRKTSTDIDVEDEVFQPVTERLDMQAISAGITLLILYALVSVYLMSPAMNRPHRR
jgi:hypothetical protein